MGTMPAKCGVVLRFGYFRLKDNGVTYIPTRVRLRWAALLSVLLTFAACSRSPDCNQSPDVSGVAAPVRLERLEQPFFQLKSPADARQFLAQHRPLARLYLQEGQFPSPDVLAQTLATLATNPELQKLGRETETVFKNTDSLQTQLQGLFQHVRYYYPTFRVPLVETFVGGFQTKELFVNDSLLVLGLDYYAGPQASYRPDLPAYIQRRYTPAHLLPAVALALSSKYNRREVGGQPNMLGELVQFGKSLYFAEKMLPCTPDSLLIGYTAKELAGVEFNEGRIWAHFISKNLLYNTNPLIIKKYVGERPDVPELDKTAPGRVGAWVGWQMVRKYMAEHPDVTLPQLMAERNPQRILNGSHYKPKRR